MRLLILFGILGFVIGIGLSCVNTADAQGLVIGGSSSGNITPACVAPPAGAGNVTVMTVSGTDCIDMTGNGVCSNACQVTGDSILLASGQAIGFNGATNSSYIFDQTGTLQIAGASGIGLAGKVNFNQSAGSNAIVLSNSGSRINLNNGGSDFLSDISGVAVFNANLRMGNAQTNAVSFTGVGAGVAPIIASYGGDTNIGLQLTTVGGHGVVYPSIAAGSLLTCTGTYSGTNAGPGEVAYDSTNNAMATCNGTRWTYPGLIKTCSMSTSTTCTATVPTGTSCICQATTVATLSAGAACAVSSTTATCNATVANSDPWNIFVF